MTMEMPCSSLRTIRTLVKPRTLISLLLSNLRSLSPLLGGSELHPSERRGPPASAVLPIFRHGRHRSGDSRTLRGPSVFPRPDGAGFIRKLGRDLGRAEGMEPSTPIRAAPAAPKDDQGRRVRLASNRRTVFPAFFSLRPRSRPAGTGKDKSIKSHIAGVFQRRWFLPDSSYGDSRIPRGAVRFARTTSFRDDVLVLGQRPTSPSRAPPRVRSRADSRGMA